MPQPQPQSAPSLPRVPYTFVAKTVSDSDSDNERTGAMYALTNLVPNQGTKDQWVPRPAAIAFPGTVAQFSPGFVSAQIVVGNVIYGMVSSALNPGYDQPFAYNILTDSYIAISGILSTNVPISPPTTGDWTPPTMDIVGNKVLVTHPGFSGVGQNFFGMITITDPTTLSWSCLNTTTIVLPAVPVYVKNFFNRAYFVCNLSTGATTYASDQLLGAVSGQVTMTNPYILTYGDSSKIMALGVLGQHNVIGGITQTLLIFKQNNVYSVTGDFSAATPFVGSVSLNSLNIATGCIAPLGISPIARGLIFVSPDGVRIIDWDVKVSPPIGLAGTGVNNPFKNALVPSRIVVASSGETVRFTVQNNGVIGQPNQDFIYDLDRQVWSGPHTFPASLISAYLSSYIVSPIGVKGLWQSDVIPTSGSTYTENGVALQWTWLTQYIANNNSVFKQSINLSTIYIAGDGNANIFSVSAIREDNTVLDTVSVSVIVGTSGLIWDVGKWDVGLWDNGPPSLLNQIQIPWTHDLVFDRIAFKIVGSSSLGVTIGSLRTIFESLAYVGL